MNVSLPPDLAAMIRHQIESGRYHDADEVVRDALRQMADRQRRITELRAAIAVAEDQIARGQVVEWTPELHAEIFARAEEAFKQGRQPKSDFCP